MPRTKALTTHAREIAKNFSPDQLRQLAEALQQEATKPRLDRKELTRLHREFRNGFVRSNQAEFTLVKLLEATGRTASQIESELESLRKEAQKDWQAVAGKPIRRRGRPPKSAAV